ncbi:MAG: caspase family protein [bacterium]|nr:caspase family protein [bacterium]
MVCYTGHGWAADGRYFLIPHDVKPHQLTATALPAEAFIAGLRSIRARRLLVLLDTCHAEAMASAKGSVPLLPDGFRQEPLPKNLAEELKDVRELSEGEGRAVFTSCLQEQKSWIMGDDSLSIFTHHLIAALKGAGNPPAEKFVMVSDLMKYVSREVEETAREMNQEQNPFVMFETQDFPVALIRGGTRDQDDQGANHQGEGRESRTYNVHSGRDTFFARDVGSIRTGDSTSSDR